LKEAEDKGWQVIMLDGSEDSFSITEVHPPDKCILLIGNEANGVDPELFSPRRMKVRIDGEDQEHVESLNAAIALGIGLFELNKP
jgi:tRNA G18 (ribose-2'-O)-methylase SpoU